MSELYTKYAQGIVAEFEAKLDAERRARQEAEAQAAAMAVGLQTIHELWAGNGERDLRRCIKLTLENVDFALATDAGKRMLAIVEAARRYVRAERELMAIFDGPDTDKVIELERTRNELHDELMRAVGGDSQ